jgi:HlyD family secretion protein
VGITQIARSATTSKRVIFSITSVLINALSIILPDRKEIILNISHQIMKHLLKLLLVLSCVFLLIPACKNRSPDESFGGKTMTISAEPQQLQLYFNGTIAPITTHTITSPVDGAVAKMFFQFGDNVQNNQPLLTIVSKDLAKDYQTALSAFLNAKQKYTDSQVMMSGTEYLYKAGLIPRNDYLNALSNLGSANLSFIQARAQLENLLSLIKLSKSSVELLKVGQQQAIEKAFNQTIGNIAIQANASGIALLPPKDSSSADSGSGNATLQVGSEIKSGQALLSIGDMSGIAININVDEISINQIKPGLPAIITSPAFPNITLQGYVKTVSAQATQQQGSSLPTFNATIVVPKITSVQAQQIHEGMTAQVNIVITKPLVISIPINAVKQNNGQATVSVIDKKNQMVRTVPVTTGTTTLNTVEITKGLKVGDEVVISH